MKFESSNPTLSADIFHGNDSSFAYSSSGAMTVGGAAVKTLLLLALAFGTAIISWNSLAQGTFSPIWLIGSAVGALIAGFVIYFKPSTAPYVAPVYAALEGVFLGAISALFDRRFPGIASQAMLGTFGVFGVMLALYTTRTVRVTPGFTKFVIAATCGIALTYMIAIVLRLFGVTVPFLNQPNPIGIGISVFVVAIASMTLLLDFKMIEQFASEGAPKSMEWYGAYALMASLVWLYFEILRLLWLLYSFFGSSD